MLTRRETSIHALQSRWDSAGSRQHYNLYKPANLICLIPFSERWRHCADTQGVHGTHLSVPHLCLWPRLMTVWQGGELFQALTHPLRINHKERHAGWQKGSLLLITILILYWSLNYSYTTVSTPENVNHGHIHYRTILTKQPQLPLS